MIKSTPMPAWWVIHKLKNNNIKEVLLLLRRFEIPHQASEGPLLVESRLCFLIYCLGLS